MKKNRLAILAVMSMLFLAMTVGCKGKKSSVTDKEDDETETSVEDDENSMEVVLEVDVSEVLDMLSGYKTDSIFRQVLEYARRQQEMPEEFIDCFYDQWVRQASGRPLCELFATQQLRDKVTATSDDGRVLNVLKQELRAVMENTEIVLRNRVENAGLDCDIELLDNTMRLKATISDAIDSERVLHMLASSGNLEFWETYSVNDIVPSLQRLIQDYAEQRSDEGYQQPDFQFYFSGQAAVGQASVRDTAALNRIYQSDRGQRLLHENNLKLLWGAKAICAIDSIDQFELYAIRVTDPSGRAALAGDIIVSARAEQDQMCRPCVIMQMNTSATREWERITRENIGRAIAIVLDDAVLTAPLVNSAIAGGASQISGNFTLEETRDIADVLSSGYLPVGVRIISVKCND